MSHSRESQIGPYAQSERLARAFYTNGRYNPHFLIITAVGFFTIYVLTLMGVFGQPAPQLIAISVLTFLLGLSQFPLLALARRDRGVAANLLGSIAVGIFAVLLTYFWQGIMSISILIAVSAPVSALRNGLPRRYIPIVVLILAAAVAGIIYVERTSAFDRLQNSTPAAIASFAFLVAALLLLITITTVSENKNFRSLQTLLLTSFILIVIILTLLATALSTIGAFTSSQESTNFIKSLVGSIILTLFLLSIAIAAVAFLARSIVQPITSLAQTMESFATGKLSARALVDRADEIGNLARSYNQMATQLQEVIGGLEQRVNERTGDLESQTARLRAAAEVARDAASARDLGDLLERSAELIQNRFGFFHAGIFLLDNERQYAILVASPSEAGKQMLANNHRLRVGEAEIVGRVAATGEPRITLDTDVDVVHFNNPYLPNTRSEMALPLKAEKSVIGVLDIQSDQPQAFNADDVAILQIMADQLATAIERTRLLQEVERSLKELESAYGQYTRENWKSLSENIQSGNKGYHFDNIRMESITELSELGKSAFESGTTISSNGHGTDRQTAVAIPVKLRGQTIGVINLKLKENYAEDTISTVELASERLAAALESARLYEEARLRADREQSIAQVTSAISASTTYDEILQTTVREIGSTLRDAEVTIQISGDLKDNGQTG